MINYAPLKAVMTEQAQELEKELLKVPLFVQWQNKMKAIEYIENLQRQEKEKK